MLIKLRALFIPIVMLDLMLMALQTANICYQLKK